MPTVLPNVSLFANEIRNYNVVYTDTPEKRTNKHDINIPDYIPINNDDDRQMVVQAGVYSKLLFSSMRFQNKDESYLYLSKMLISLQYATNLRKKTLIKLGGAKRHQRVKTALSELAIKNGLDGIMSDETNDYIAKYPEVLAEHDLTKEDVKFHKMYRYNYLRYTYDGFDISEDDTEHIIWRAVRNLYQDKDENKFLETLIKTLCMSKDRKLYVRNKQFLERVVYNYTSYNIPVEIKQQDVHYIANLCELADSIIGSTQRYISNTNWENNPYVFNQEKQKYVVRTYKLSKKQLRYRLNRVYKLLKGGDYYSRSIVRGMGNSKLPSTEYVQPEVTNDKQQQIMPEGITLPKELSDGLKQDIMQSADRQHERHFVDHRTNDGGMHGKAKLHKFKPNSKIHKAIRELRKRSSDSGVVPKNMHRLTTDRKVFQHRKSIAGGSMMIDCSGSMGFYASDIQQIVELLPASWIAGYVGYNRKIEDCDGDIRIIADKGSLDTTAIDDLNQYGCNSVDFEALQLLAKQPEPRLWVSDQQVIGVNEHGSATTLNSVLLKEIERFMLINNIIPIKDIDMVKEVAKQLSVRK